MALHLATTPYWLGEIMQYLPRKPVIITKRSVSRTLDILDMFKIGLYEENLSGTPPLKRGTTKAGFNSPWLITVSKITLIGFKSAFFYRVIVWHKFQTVILSTPANLDGLNPNKCVCRSCSVIEGRKAALKKGKVPCVKVSLLVVGWQQRLKKSVTCFCSWCLMSVRAFIKSLGYILSYMTTNLNDDRPSFSKVRVNITDICRKLWTFHWASGISGVIQGSQVFSFFYVYHLLWWVLTFVKNVNEHCVYAFLLSIEHKKKTYKS